LNNDGTYSFDPGTDLDSLAEGTSASLDFIYQVESDGATVSHFGMIQVAGTDDATVLDVTDGSATTIGDLIASAVSITDVDTSVFTSATVRLADGFYSLQDSLAFTAPDGSGMAGSFDSATGILTISGSAGAADYQAALASVTFQSSEDQPTTGGRTVEVTVTNQNGASNTETLTLAIAGVDNHAPEAVLSTISADEDVGVTGNLTSFDAEGDAVSYELVDGPEHGTLTLNPDGSYRSVTDGDLETLDDGETQDVTFTYRLSDGTDTTLHTGTITVTGHDEAAISGLSVDGYIEGATVFADEDGDLAPDGDEATATTGINGVFDLENPLGGLVQTGGTDAATGVAFTGMLRAPAGSGIITPLTTLVAWMMDNGTSQADAESAVESAFGLDAAL
ncbi:MAG: VCBS domain-containing protein, partial [Rhodospirillales bacterium]